MKRYIRSATTGSSKSLDDLIEGMWYETVQNYKDDTSIEDMIDIAVEHVIMYIEEMDDDEEFTEYLAKVNTPEFDKYVRRMCQKYSYYVN